MCAVRAPFAMSQTGEGLVGRVAGIAGKLYRIVAIMRETGGPIAAGATIGVEVSPAADVSASPAGSQ
jgi:hypothetical protein